MPNMIISVCKVEVEALLVGVKCQWLEIKSSNLTIILRMLVQEGKESFSGKPLRLVLDKSEKL